MNKINSLKKKIIYRSEYRGIKEMDLLLGKFVKKYIDNFNYQSFGKPKHIDVLFIFFCAKRGEYFEILRGFFF